MGAEMRDEFLHIFYGDTFPTALTERHHKGRSVFDNNLVHHVHRIDPFPIVTVTPDLVLAWAPIGFAQSRRINTYACSQPL